MTNEELIRQLDSLPAGVRSFIERYITMAAERTRKRAAEKPRGSFRDDPAFGMWKDREDMKMGGAAWVRKLRDEHWKR